MEQLSVGQVQAIAYRRRIAGMGNTQRAACARLRRLQEDSDVIDLTVEDAAGAALALVDTDER